MLLGGGGGGSRHDGHNWGSVWSLSGCDVFVAAQLQSTRGYLDMEEKRWEDPSSSSRKGMTAAVIEFTILNKLGAEAVADGPHLLRPSQKAWRHRLGLGSDVLAADWFPARD